MEAIDKSVIIPAEKIFTTNVIPFIQQPVVQLFVFWLITVNVVNNFNNNFSKYPEIVQVVATSEVAQGLSLFFAAYYITKDFRLALVSTIVYVISFVLLGIYREKFQIIPTTDSMITCTSVTVKDLLDKYNGDESALKRRMFSAGVPINIALTDYNAPLIASHLVGHGESFGTTCAPPM